VQGGHADGGGWLQMMLAAVNVDEFLWLRGDALRGEGVQGWVEAIELLLFALNDHVKVSLKVGLLEAKSVEWRAR